MRTSVIVFFSLVIFRLPTITAAEDSTAVPESFVEAIARARELIAADGSALPYQFTAPKERQNAAFLNQLIGHQKHAALSELHLGNALEELEGLKEVRDRAPRRWQALYDYTTACLLNRLVARREYNCLLGELRRTLPDQDSLPLGWELVPRERPSDATAQKLWRRATEQMNNVLADYQDLPWVVQLAKRERAVGLTWKVIAREP
jgi:hypothetical protein